MITTEKYGKIAEDRLSVGYDPENRTLQGNKDKLRNRLRRHHDWNAIAFLYADWPTNVRRSYIRV